MSLLREEAQIADRLTEWDFTHITEVGEFGGLNHSSLTLPIHLPRPDMLSMRLRIHTVMHKAKSNSVLFQFDVSSFHLRNANTIELTRTWKRIYFFHIFWHFISNLFSSSHHTLWRDYDRDTIHRLFKSIESIIWHITTQATNINGTQGSFENYDGAYTNNVVYTEIFQQ